MGADSGFTDPFRDLLFPFTACIRPTVTAAQWERLAPLATSIAWSNSNGCLAEKHGEIAAVIVEPLLQGAGGMIVHPVEFLQRVRESCTRTRVLLIADEVLTGFGRCGKMFACELAGVIPDMMCLPKG